MSPVFADTSFYQALLSKRDEWHPIVAELLNNIQDTIVTTEYVLPELAALMSRGAARSLFVEFVRRPRSDASTEVIPTSTKLFNGGLSLFAARPDKEWSLIDCISSVVMQDQGISCALTYDRHFEQAGFRLLVTL